MAGGKQTPRQRMMGILYLVLLGLIALDVPDSLLDAFKNISDSLSASTKNVQTGVEKTFSTFEQTKLKTDHERALLIYNKAKKAAMFTDDLTAYVENIRKKFIDETGDIDPATNDYKGREDMDASVRIMVQNKLGYDLKKKIEDTKEKLLALLSDKEKEGVNLSLNTDNPPHRDGFPNKDWAQANFGEGIPVAAAMTGLTKIIADNKNAENEVVKKILGEEDQAVVNLDHFAAVAVAPTSYVIAGQPYSAKIFLTASDSKSNPDITVNGNRLPAQDGEATYTAGTSGSGEITWEGKIKVKQNNGRDTTYSTGPIKYTVALPSAVVSPEKMNVLYIGIDNPLAVSAPGIALNKLHLSMSGGSVTQDKPGHFIADVTALGTATASVSGEVSPGKTMSLGSSIFRVKRIPPPEAEFAGSGGGSVSAVNLRGENYIFAKLENFEFDVKFQITHFTMSVYKPRQDVFPITGNNYQLTGAMHTALNQVVPGCTVVFSNILATGPKNTQYSLKPIVLTAN
jgi:gliding motility-associated protein GldM